MKGIALFLLTLPIIAGCSKSGSNPDPGSQNRYSKVEFSIGNRHFSVVDTFNHTEDGMTWVSYGFTNQTSEVTAKRHGELMFVTSGNIPGTTTNISGHFRDTAWDGTMFRLWQFIDGTYTITESDGTRVRGSFSLNANSTAGPAVITGTLDLGIPF